MIASEKIDQVCASLFAVQRDIANPPKNAKGQVRGKSDYRYLDLPALLEVVKPLCKDAQAFVTQENVGDDRTVAVLTRFWHFGGQYLELGPFVVPYDGTAQGSGSAWTYGRRYALLGLFGIAPEDDDDGASAGRSTPRKGTTAKETGEGSRTVGGGGVRGSSPPVPPAAADDLWTDLLAVVEQSMVRATNRINRANGTAYTKETARSSATVDELVAALTGGEGS